MGVRVAVPVALGVTVNVAVGVFVASGRQPMPPWQKASSTGVICTVLLIPPGRHTSPDPAGAPGVGGKCWPFMWQRLPLWQHYRGGSGERREGWQERESGGASGGGADGERAGGGGRLGRRCSGGARAGTRRRPSGGSAGRSACGGERARSGPRKTDVAGEGYLPGRADARHRGHGADLYALAARWRSRGGGQCGAHGRRRCRCPGGVGVALGVAVGSNRRRRCSRRADVGLGSYTSYCSRRIRRLRAGTAPERLSTQKPVSQPPPRQTQHMASGARARQQSAANRQHRQDPPRAADLASKSPRLTFCHVAPARSPSLASPLYGPTAPGPWSPFSCFNIGLKQMCLRHHSKSMKMALTAAQRRGNPCEATLWTLSRRRRPRLVRGAAAPRRKPRSIRSAAPAESRP